MFDTVFLLIAVVCVEVGVMSAGLFWYLPRVINRTMKDAEVMIAKVREETFDELQGFIEGILSAENIQKGAAIIAPVLGDHIKRAAGGLISSTVRRKSGDFISDIIGNALGSMMGGGVPSAPPGESSMGFPPPQ